MILDSLNLLSDAQAFDADAYSTNIIDLTVTGRRIGAGDPLVLVLFVDVAADHTTGNETFNLEVHTDDDVAFGSATVLASVPILYSALTQYSKHVIMIDPSWDFERYVAYYHNGGGTTPTITATVAIMPFSALRTWKAYPNAYTITH